MFYQCLEFLLCFFLVCIELSSLCGQSGAALPAARTAQTFREMLPWAMEKTSCAAQSSKL